MDKEFKDKTEFLLKHSDKHYSEEEFNRISELAKEHNASLEEALVVIDPDIQQKRKSEVAEQEKSVDNPPVPESETSPEKPIEEMTDKEHKAYEKEQLGE